VLVSPPIGNHPLTRARRFAWPLPDLWASNSLTDDDLREYWHFRRGFMDLKPHVDPEADYASFAAWVRASDFVWLRRDHEDRLIATMAAKVERRTHEGRECVLVWPEYAYVLPNMRGPANIATALVAAMSLGAVRWPGRPLYAVAAGYASSWMSVSLALDRAWVREHPDMSPWERSVWQTLATETKGYDPTTQLVEMGTIPKNPRTHRPRDPRMLSRYQQYVAHNPRWTEGYTCLVFGQLRAKDVPRVARWVASRAVGRASRSSAGEECSPSRPRRRSPTRCYTSRRR
jgi:hypothetical protein